MSQRLPDHPPDDARDLLERNIRKTVAVSTLRRIRGIVDDYDEEQAQKDRLSRRVLAAGLIVAVVLAIVLVTTGGALPRVITAVLGWFRG